MGQENISSKIKDKPDISIYCTFALSGNEFAMDVEYVQEVVNYPSKVIPMPLSPPFLEGVFNLRGSIVPIVNLKKILNFELKVDNNEVKLAIINYQGYLIALMFDSTGEIFRLRDQQLDFFEFPDESTYKTIKGAIKLEEGKRIIQILDPMSLVSIKNLPLSFQSSTIQKTSRAKSTNSARKMAIVFSVAEVKMAFSIQGIHEIIKVPEVKSHPLRSDICIGIINLRNQTIPVVDFAKLLNCVQPVNSDPADKRIIIVKVSEFLIGLLTDCVDSINNYRDEEVSVIPILSKERTKLFQGCLNFNDLGDVFLLDHNELFKNEELNQITQGHSQIYKSNFAAYQKNKIKERENEFYLSFRMGQLFGVKLKEVKEIIIPPKTYLSSPGMPFFVKGLLNLRGELVTIVDPKKLYKFESSLTLDVNDSEQRILVYKFENEFFGLIVDSVDSIFNLSQVQKLQVPDFFKQGQRNHFEKDINDIVQITPKDSDQRLTLMILNLVSLIDRIRTEKVA
ncbi:MAG: chemotaxis protein CheW [Bdellovibrionaceae bacterium]|nr:chemotaxis protein CheW [Pseudobdellovibrionaceae bacterium]